jgi:hypothetical protein
VTYEPPTNPSLWQVLLADEDGYVTTAAAALDEHGPESHVDVSIRRLSALPTQMGGGWWLTNRPEDEADIATEWKLNMVDDIGETDHIDAQLKTAQAMAAGLNGALANQGDWNRSNDLAASLHGLADKIALFAGELPDWVWLSFHLADGRYPSDRPAIEAVAAVDAFAVALFGTPGQPDKEATGWQHKRQEEMPGSLTARVYTAITAPAEEDPAALRAQIAELKAKLAGGAA